MPTLGIEMCDAGFQAASCDNNEAKCLSVVDANGVTDWPGFAYYDGNGFTFGRAAEDQWFVHPRRVTHTFWSRLTHEAATIGAPGKLPPYSQLAYFFLREFVLRTNSLAGASGKVVLAVPGAYLKDPATEEEKIGLILGMAGELNLPVAGIIDMACAALCDPRAHGFNPALPVVVLDLHLEGADLTLLKADEKLERKDFIHLPQSGYAQLLKHLTGTMGNRFLRHTAFDILEDGRIEQTFFRQTKDFLLRGMPEHRFQINTAMRAYEMLAKREQLAQDSQTFVNTLVQGLQTFVHNSPHGSEPCTIALTDRSIHLPGLETRLRAAGFGRILRLPAGAAACGAARIGDSALKVPEDLGDVPVETSAALSFMRRSVAAPWEARLQKLRQAGPRPTPTHVILEGIGHSLAGGGRFTIGLAGLGADLVLPDTFSSADDCTIPLLREGGRVWFVDTSSARDHAAPAASPARTTVEAGDRLTIRCGGASADVLFAHCATNGARGHD